MCAIEMSADLKRAVGEPILLFKASEASWIAEAQKNKGIYVTDGPFPYRCADGTLLCYGQVWAKKDIQRLLQCRITAT